MKKVLRGLKDNFYDEIEVKVREATNSESWGASSTLMAEIARATHSYEEYPKLMRMLWKRLRDYPHYRHVHKALLLIEYLARNAHPRFLRDAQHRANDIRKLRRYKYYNKENVDIAGDIRKKAKSVHELLTNEEQLQSEREKAQQIRGVREQHATNTSSSGSSSIRSRSYAAETASRSSSHARGNGASNGSSARDPYDSYSSTARSLARKSGASKGSGASSGASSGGGGSSNGSSKKAAEANPFESEPVADDPFGDVGGGSSRSGKKKKKKREKESKKESKKKSKKKKSKSKKTASGDGGGNDAPPSPPSGAEAAPAFEEAFGGGSGNPFEEMSSSSSSSAKKVADPLEQVFDPTVAAGSRSVVTSKPVGGGVGGGAGGDDFDFLTGAVEQLHVSGSNESWEQSFGGGEAKRQVDANGDAIGEAGLGGGFVMDSSSDSDSSDSSDDEDDEAGGGRKKKVADDDIFGLVNIDDIHDAPVPKKKEVKKQAKKAAKQLTMQEMMARRPSVVVGEAIEGLEATAPAPAPTAASPVPGVRTMAPGMAGGPAHHYHHPQPAYPAMGYPPAGVAYPPQHGMAYGVPAQQPQQPQQPAMMMMGMPQHQAPAAVNQAAAAAYGFGPAPVPQPTYQGGYGQRR